MGLSTGSRVGPYVIVGAIGAGGMGEVYRARDSRLGRDVAIKILPSGFTADRERLARFEREAQLLAALNNSHIAAIYGIEETDGSRALVLELVEGETLAERISRGITIDEALTIARQIAEALEAAHERGIIHRDIKPANVAIASDGNVKVLDFGLAKAASDDSSVSDEASTAIQATREGTILGTAGYMSPEQARGKTVDKRTDIWAFGCVLFEMLAGQPPFAGETLSDTLASILQGEPAWDRLPNATPVSVRRLVRRCLEKDPKRRLRDIGEARIALENAVTNPASEEEPRVEPAHITRRTVLSALGGAIAGAAGVAMLGPNRWRTSLSRNLARFAIAIPEGDFLQVSFNDRVAFSPDGRRVAFNTVRNAQPGGIYIRELRDLVSRHLDQLDRGAAAFFSPDGAWLGFFRVAPQDVSLRKVRLSGGAPATICASGAFAGATWAEDNTIYFISEVPGGLLAVPAAGGQPKEVLKIDTAHGERVFKYPIVLPGGNAVLLTLATVDSESFDDAQIIAFSPHTGQRKTLVERGTHPRYSRSGHLVFARDGKLLAIRFDPDRLEVTGQPVTVLDGVMMSRNTGIANFDMSGNGDLVYVPGVAEGGARSLVWVDRSGKPDPLPLPPRSYLHPRISPDARQLAIEIEGANHDVYLYDFASSVLSNLTNDGVSHWPVWSADGRNIGYRSGPMGRFQLWQIAADRSRPPQRVPASGSSQSIESYSPDGKVLAYTAVNPEKPPAITLLPLFGDRTPRPLEATKYAQGSPKFSPDGRRLAYCSNESGKAEVYVQALPGPGAKIQVSNAGGTDPVWRRDGRELFYRSGDSMMAVAVATESGFRGGRPQELWRGHYSHGMSTSCGAPGATSSNYDVTADGNRFLMIKDNDQDATTSRQIIVALGWGDELNRLSRVS
jgi:serine/threonine protein kinase/Tol biopolymer transport system component